MDGTELIQRGKQLIQTYRYPMLILLIGVLLMLYPSKQPTAQIEGAEPIENISQLSLEERLSDILCTMEGAGKVRVLLTEAAGEETILQTNDQLSSDEKSCSERSEAVIISDSQRVQSGIVRQVNPPTYQGAIVLCQGAERASVRLAIVEAISNAVGLSYDKITVLKMK